MAWIQHPIWSLQASHGRGHRNGNVGKVWWCGWGFSVWQAWKLSLPKNTVIEVPLCLPQTPGERVAKHNFLKGTSSSAGRDEQRVAKDGQNFRTKWRAKDRNWCTSPPGVKVSDSWRKVDKNPESTVDGRFRLLREVVSFRRCGWCEWIPLKWACGGTFWKHFAVLAWLKHLIVA